MRPLLIAFALLFAVPARGLAQEMGIAEMEEARELYAAGSLAAKEGRWADAEAAFHRVYQLGHSPSVARDLAEAIERQEHHRAAADAWDEYLRAAKKVDNREALERHVVELRLRAAEEARAIARPRPRWVLWAAVGGAVAAAAVVGVGVGVGVSRVDAGAPLEPTTWQLGPRAP